MPSVPNVLASRYASPAIRTIWSPEGRIVLERELWIAVMRAQRDLGLEIPEEAIAAYESAKGDVDLASIRGREEVTRHDVKARIEEFCELAGHQHIHKGMTSRDLTENVEALQVFRSLLQLRTRAGATLAAFSRRGAEHRDLPLAARTHNVAAQLTTLGRRLAMFGEELLLAFRDLEALITSYPARGLKGAVGTQLDQLTLFGGNLGQARDLDNRIREHLGLPAVLEAPGQVYPRSLDHRVVSTLVSLGSGPSSFARTLRLMAGHETAGEGFAPGQVGSSAMPHKMNSRSCERINGFHAILKGHLAMVGALAGDQWNEGDVSCSVVRRVALPDAFFATDGLLETTLTVLSQMGVAEEVIRREREYYLPFLLTTTILMEAAKMGAGREEAHEAIKEHAVATLHDLRSGAAQQNDLFERLADDARIGLGAETLQRILAGGGDQTGAAASQVDAFCQQVQETLEPYPEALEYKPGAIL